MSGSYGDAERIRLLEAELEALRASAAGRARKRFRVKAVAPRQGRDRGCWVLRVYGPGLTASGRRELTRIPFEDDTRRRAEGAALVRQGRLNGEGLTLLEVLAQYSAGRSSSVSKSTRGTDRQARRRLEQSEFVALRDPLRGAEVLALRDYLAGHYRASSASLVFGNMKSAWRWAQARDLVSAPWPELPRRRTARGDKCKKRAFSEEEVADLLNHFAVYRGGRYLPLCWALAETACRISELVALEVRDAAPSVDGGAVLQIGRRVPTKTGAPRTAAVSPALACCLELARDPESPLFRGIRDPALPLHVGSFGSAMTTWLKAVGLFGVRDTHSLRRRGAVRLHQSGVPVEIAKRVTGHESSQVFLSYAERGEYRLEDERRLLWVAPPRRDS